MYYFVTDETGKDWLGRQWTEETSFTEENPNYYFSCYQSPLVALFLSPAFDAYKNPQLWLAEPYEEQKDYDFRHISAGLKVLRKISVPEITAEQRIVFGIVCALNVISNKVFVDWGLAWLKNEDRSVERARQLSEKLLEQMWEDFVGPGHAACMAVLEDVKLYAACAAHRAYCDSGAEPLDLNQIATIVTMLSAQEIGHMLGGDDGRGTNNSGVGPHEAPLPDGEQAGPTQDMDSGRSEDVRHGDILPGSEEKTAAIPPERGDSTGS